MVGNVSLLMVNVAPTLMTIGRHDLQNALSFVVTGIISYKYGILANSIEVSVTSAANSRHSFKMKKQIIPIATIATVKICPTEILSRIARNREEIMINSPAMR